MKSLFTFNILSAHTNSLPSEELPAVCELKLRFADAVAYKLHGGELVIQSYSDFFVYFFLIEYQAPEDVEISLRIDEPVFIMCAATGTHSGLSGAKGTLSPENLENSTLVGHFLAGDYSWKLTAGKHKVLLMEFQKKWFINIGSSLGGFDPIIKNYVQSGTSNYELSVSQIADKIFAQLQKQLAKVSSSKPEFLIYRFVRRCIIAYNKHLLHAKFSGDVWNRLKSEEIQAYINEHYADKEVADLKKLAYRFNVSMSTLQRLGKISLDMPMYDYIIRYRMNKALLILGTTTKSVKEVAAEVGYSDPLYFSKAFKKFHGVPPSEVRGMLR